MKRQQLYLSTVDENAQYLAKEFGLGLELAEFCTAWNLDDEFPQTDASVREKMTYTDRFTLHGPFNELAPCAVDRQARRLARFRFLQTIKVARGYGVHKIILHGGFHPKVYYPIWYTEQSAIFWKEFLEEVPKDMVICIENVLEPEPGMMADFIRSIDDPRIRMTLDVGHANAYSQVSVQDWVRSCADILDHFHIHNNDGTWDYHNAVFDGTIPMEALLDTIETLCPNATLTLELPDARASIEWLRDQNILEDPL